MPAREPLPHGRARAPRGVAAAIAGLLGAPLVFLAALHGLYPLVSWSCRAEHEVWLHAGHLLALILTLGAVALSLREWRRLGSGSPGDHGEPADRNHFVAACGVMLGGIVALMIVGQWLSLAFLSPCAGA